MWRRTTDYSAWVVDEWLPAHQVSIEEVWERTVSAGLPYHWCYDSHPGAMDRAGSSRCSCSACTLANHRDLLLMAGRRPRLAHLCALVERVRQVPFNPNITMAELIALSRRRDAPDPGLEVEEIEDFERMERDVHAALRKPPTWDSNARTGPGELLHRAAGWLQLTTTPPLTPIREGYSMTLTTTQRILDLAAAALASHGEDLVLLLGEANELYQQGLQALHRERAERLGQLATADLLAAAQTAGLPCDASQDRAEVILLLALTEWERTPAAMAFIEMAEAAARRGVCLIPEP